MSNTTLVRTETIREIERDTVIEIQADSASIKALLACDSVGNVLLKQIAAYEAGKHVPPPKLDIRDNVLTAKVQVDSFGIYMKLFDRYMERTDFTESREERIVYENRLTGWQRLRIGLANGILLIVPIYFVFKSRESIGQWIKSLLFKK